MLHVAEGRLQSFPSSLVERIVWWVHSWPNCTVMLGTETYVLYNLTVRTSNIELS